MKLILAISMAAILGLSACGKRSEPAPDTVVDAIAGPTTEEGLSAMLRSHPHALNICYDSVIDGYFLHYKEAVAGAEPDDDFHGWYLLQNMRFYKLSNRSWFTTEQPESRYIRVYPDTSGLQCRNQ